MHGTVVGIITLILMVLFLGIVLWAYSRGNKQRFERASRLPLEDGAEYRKRNNGDRSS